MIDKNIFFIFSTARCRSTWFANFFTYKNTFCYNEESRYMSCLDDIYERVSQRKEYNVGFSDPELFHYIEKIHKEFPTARYLFLERDLQDSLESLHNISSIPKNILIPKYSVWEKNICYLKNNMNFHTINFNSMDDVLSVSSAWKYILPEEEFDVGRYELLSSMLISVTIANKPYNIHPNSISPYFDLKKIHNIKNEEFHYNSSIPKIII